MPPSTRLSREEVVHRIRLLVTRRQLMPGERIGTERALAQAFGVSRFELRAALEQLESTHEIARRIGRNGGVIVSDGRLERNLNTLESLAHMAKRQGCELTCTLMRAAVTSANEADMRILRLPTDRTTVYAVRRLRLLDGEPLSVETSRLPAYMFPGFLDCDLEAPFYIQFERRYCVRAKSVDEALDCASAPHEVCEALGIGDHAQVLRVRRVTYDGAGRPCERSMDLYNPTRIRFTSRASGAARAMAHVRSAESAAV